MNTQEEDSVDSVINQSAPEKFASFRLGIKIKFSFHIELIHQVFRLVIVQIITKKIVFLKQSLENFSSKSCLK